MIPTSEVAARLGVKKATVYAYVSRGLLSSIRRPGQLESLFHPDEVAALAQKADRSEELRAMAFRSIASSVSEQQSDALEFRGLDALQLALELTVEDAAALVLGLDASPASSGVPPVLPPGVDQPMGVQDGASLPAGKPTRGVDVMLARLAALDEASRSQGMSAEAVHHFMVDVSAELAADGRGGIPAAGRHDPRGIAGSVLAAGGNRAPSPEQVALMNTALVLMLDNGLTASTVAARVAASVRGSWQRCVGAGLNAALGDAHGLSAYRLHHALVSDATLSSAAVRGFGHAIYKDGDPRADLLLGQVKGWQSANAVKERLRAAQRAHPSGERREPNVDAALVVVASACRVVPETLTVMFTLPRIAGMAAHVVEEYQEPSGRWRARATSVKPSEPSPPAQVRKENSSGERVRWR